MDEICYLSLTEASRKIRARELSPVEVTEAALARIMAHDTTYRTFITLLGDRALRHAKIAEDEIAKGRWRGPLHGIPLAVKDSIATAYAPTSDGMHIHRDRILKTTATAVERLENAGAVILGKLSMSEAAMAVHDPKMPKPRNPWNAEYWSGASSSGAAVATASGFCFGALGTDSGGSIRIPSGACNLTGMKPTWGRVSRAGVCAQSESLDHIGPLARTVEDCALILAAIAGPDFRDPTAMQVALPDYQVRTGCGLKGTRIGVDENWVFNGCHPDVGAILRDAIEILASLGASIVPISFPQASEITKAWGEICSTEAARSHALTYPSQKDEYSKEIAVVLERGLTMPGRDLVSAYVYRDVFKGLMSQLFVGVDTLICPIIPARIPTSEGWDEIARGDGDFEQYTKFTVPFDLSGNPSLAIQGGFDANGVPVGFQLVGQHFGEDCLFSIGHAYQMATDWHLKHPVI